MTKTLTEKLKDGELAGGWYFLLFTNGSTLPVYYDIFNKEFEFRWDYEIDEVLTPCSYEYLQELEKKLDVATKALYLLNREVAGSFDRTSLVLTTIREALSDIRGEK